jgi:hypothetical protein
MNGLPTFSSWQEALSRWQEALSLWQEALLLGVVVLALIYVFYFRIWLAVAVGSDLLFALALGITVTSIVFPTAFDYFASALISRSPLPAALDAADAKVASIEALPGALIDRALAKLGVSSDEDERGDARQDIRGNAAEAEEEVIRPEPGPFVSAIRPSVDALVSTTIRLASFFCGSFLMLTSLAMRASTTTARKLNEMAERIEWLESTRAECRELDERSPV